jgi:hypothetical protein
MIPHLALKLQANSKLFRQIFVLALGVLKGRNRGDGAPGRPNGNADMPSLLRVLLAVGILVGLGYGAMLALVTYVDPRPREMTVTVSPDRFVKQQR